MPLIVALEDWAIVEVTHSRLKIRRRVISRTLSLPSQTDLDTLTRSTQEFPTLVSLPKHDNDPDLLKSR